MKPPDFEFKIEEITDKYAKFQVYFKGKLAFQCSTRFIKDMDSSENPWVKIWYDSPLYPYIEIVPGDDPDGRGSNLY